MIEQVRVELEEIGNLVNAAGIPEEDKRVAVWCLQKLPALCEAFDQTYESRYAEEIVRVERGLILRFSESGKAPSPVRELSEALTLRFKVLHEQLGLPEFQVPKARPAAAGRSRKLA
jgi:hypothetical protein